MATRRQSRTISRKKIENSSSDDIVDFKEEISLETKFDNENKMYNLNKIKSPRRLRSRSTPLSPFNKLKSKSTPNSKLKVSKQMHTRTPYTKSQELLASPTKALENLNLNETSHSRLRSKKVTTYKEYSDDDFSPTPSKIQKVRSVTQNKTPSKLSRFSDVSIKNKIETRAQSHSTRSMQRRTINTIKSSSPSQKTTPLKSLSFRKKNIDIEAALEHFEEDDDDDDKDIDYQNDEDSESESEEISSDDDYSCKPLKTKKHAKLPNVATKTPTKSLAQLNLTPSIHRRTASIAKPSTPLQEARHKLHVSILPKSLPCREEEFNDIYTFLHSRLSDDTGGCIYISGVPGTGKTATVNEVIRCLKKSVNAGKLTKFEYADINGMKLTEPRQAYVQIWKQLTGQSKTWEEAQKLLQNRFTNTNLKKGMTLLLADELDLLCTKRQDVVYNLLDWPSKSGAKLVVVTIANTMDLPERILMGRVTSRLGLTRLTFPPYNFKQLEQIVISRLKGHNAFSGETIQLVARKVAAVSGDARRALDICRRSTEITEINGRELVTMTDVKQALEEMIASPKIQAIKNCSDLEKVFLEAASTEVIRTGVEEILFKNVYYQLESLCRFNGEHVPNITEVLAICARLGSWRLLSCDHSKMDIHQRLLLNVSTDDIQFALRPIET